MFNSTSAFTFAATRSFPVSLGDLTFYASGWKVHGQRNYAQLSSCTGACYLNNNSVQANEITLSGSFPFTESPGSLVAALDAAIRNQTSFSLTIHGFSVSVAYLKDYTISESVQNGTLPCELTFLTTGSISEAEEANS